MGWFGMDGLASLAAGAAGVGAGAGAARAACVAGCLIVPLAFAGVFLAAAAGRAA